MCPKLRLEREVQSGVGASVSAFGYTAKHAERDNFCNLLSTAQTNSACLAGLEAMYLLVSDCCLQLCDMSEGNDRVHNRS